MCLATHAGALDRCNGYVAGCNTTFFGKAKDGSYSVDAIRDQINERLTLANGEDVDYPSMLCFPEEFEAATARDQVISISNRVLPWDTTNGNSRKQFPGGDDGWAAAGGKGLEGIHYGAPRCTERPLPAKPASVFHPASAARAQARTCAPPRIKILLRRRRSTTRSASSARTASTRSGARRTRNWCQGKGTSAPTRSRGCARNSPAICAICAIRTPRSHSTFPLTGCPLAPRRVGVARVGAQRDDRHRGGGALAARLPEAQLERRRRSRPRTRRARRARRERDKRERHERDTRDLLRLNETY